MPRSPSCRACPNRHRSTSADLRAIASRGAYAALVIIVIGSPVGRLLDEGVVVAAGTAARAALAAACGRSERSAGRPDGRRSGGRGPAAEPVAGGVGHVALLRDPARADARRGADLDVDDGDPVSLDDEQVAPSRAAGTTRPSTRPTCSSRCAT